MKPRDFLNFFKTKSGRLIAFGALFAVALIIFSVVRKHHQAPEDAGSAAPLGTNTVGGKPQVVQSVVRPMQKFQSTGGISRLIAIHAGIRLYERIATTVAGCSREPIANPLADQFVCRQCCGSCRLKKVERRVCPVWPVDFLRDGHHGGFVFHANTHHRPCHRECLSRG